MKPSRLPRPIQSSTLPPQDKLEEFLLSFVSYHGLVSGGDQAKCMGVARELSEALKGQGFITSKGYQADDRE
jgi:hypothetical protein